MPKNLGEEGKAFPIEAQHEHCSLIKHELASFPVAVTAAGDLPGTLHPLRVQPWGAEGTKPFVHLQRGAKPT